jgi:lipoprotein-releasing system permease protein
MTAVDGVVRAVPVTYLSGLIDDPSEPTNPLPVVVKAVAEPPLFCGLESWPSDDLPPAVFGDRLASVLRLQPGTQATVRLPPAAGTWIVPTLQVRFIGRFRLEFSEFDTRWIVVPLEPIQMAFPKTGVAGVEVELEDPMAVDSVHAALEHAAPDLILTDWREMNEVLFAALRWQTLSLFVVLSLVVAVASFQVSSALVVLAIDKRRTTGMLQAVGARPATVRRILVFAGSILGGVGIAAGLALGGLVSLLMSWLELVRFPEGLARVYMVDHIPLVVSPVHLVAVAGVCALLVLAASWWPAWRSSRLDPVASLKAV